MTDQTLGRRNAALVQSTIARPGLLNCLRCIALRGGGKGDPHIAPRPCAVGERGRNDRLCGQEMAHLVACLLHAPGPNRAENCLQDGTFFTGPSGWWPGRTESWRAARRKPAG